MLTGLSVAALQGAVPPKICCDFTVWAMAPAAPVSAAPELPAAEAVLTAAPLPADAGALLLFLLALATAPVFAAFAAVVVLPPAGVLAAVEAVPVLALAAVSVDVAPLAVPPAAELSALVEAPAPAAGAAADVSAALVPELPV